METFIQNINDIIAASQENVSMLVKDINETAILYDYHSDQKLVSASTIKVAIMLAVLDEVRKGTIQLHDPLSIKTEDMLSDSEVFEHGERIASVYECLFWMITTSDNTATNVLIKHFGMDHINHYIQNTLGTASTVLQRYMLDEQAIKNGFNNYTSQQDMCKIFTKLFHQEILTPQLCNTASDILYRQRCQDQIMRYLYQPITFAHKTGNLDYLNHDIGIMNIKDKQYYIGISIYNSKHKKGNKPLVGTLGKAVYDYISQ